MTLLQELLNDLTETTQQTKGRKEIKPRNKYLHDLLQTKKGGAHYSPKTDYVRPKEKEKVRSDLTEYEKDLTPPPPLVKYFRYTVWNSTDGSRTGYTTGYTIAETETEAKRKLIKAYPRARSVEVREVTEEQFKQHATPNTSPRSTS